MRHSTPTPIEWCLILVLVWLASCTPAPVPTAMPPADAPGLSADEIATLESLEQLDDYPLYSLRYAGAYHHLALTAANVRLADTASLASSGACEVCWGCALFAALGDPEQRLYGRNFDWSFSPALLLFTAPPDGYASVSLVDIEYLGYPGEQAKNLADLPLNARQGLLGAPVLPFDGMNELGLAVGMAAVPPVGMQADP